MDNDKLELFPESNNRMLTGSTLIKVGEQYYETAVLYMNDFSIGDFSNNRRDFSLKDGFEIRDDIAYLIGEYYYLYKGKISDIKGFNKIEPGIYYDDMECKFVICEPTTDDEKELYKYSDKITRLDIDDIRNAILNKEIEIFHVPENAHSAIPPESINDDLLKKLVKRAITSKGIDLDQYKVRFMSKNTLFNFKQVLRGPNKLSMLLFDRFAEAFNLKYTIIVEEAGGELIGHALKENLVISNQDTFNANSKVVDNLEE